MLALKGCRHPAVLSSYVSPHAFRRFCRSCGLSAFLDGSQFFGGFFFGLLVLVLDADSGICAHELSQSSGPPEEVLERFMSFFPAEARTGLLRAFFGEAAFFGLGIGQLERAGLGSKRKINPISPVRGSATANLSR